MNNSHADASRCKITVDHLHRPGRRAQAHDGTIVGNLLRPCRNNTQLLLLPAQAFSQLAAGCHYLWRRNKVLELVKPICSVRNRDWFNFDCELFADETIVIEPTLRTRELKSVRIISSDLTRGETCFKFVVNKMCGLRVTTIARKLLYYPAFGAFRQSLHWVTYK